MLSRTYSQMNYDDRLFIEEKLNIKDITLKQISSSLHRDGKTIREEIRNNRFISISGNRKRRTVGQGISLKTGQGQSARSASLII